MLRFTNNNGTSTDWLSENPTDKELAKMNIEQLLILAKKKPVNLVFCTEMPNYIQEIKKPLTRNILFEKK